MVGYRARMSVSGVWTIFSRQWESSHDRVVDRSNPVSENIEGVKTTRFQRHLLRES